VDLKDPRLARILDTVKERESKGYAYDTAQASFELLARRELGLLPRFFEVERYRVISERRRNARGQIVTVSEAVVTVQIGADRRTSFYENLHAPTEGDAGPVNALAQALRADLGALQGTIEDMRLTDFAVRIVGSGTEAVTRVVIDSEDGQGRQWTTVGVSANIIDASFDALVDAITWKLVRDGAPVPS
jgi:2-isopropylmalate synthase